ncbi:uncharacterized protein LOC108194553 isoform X6 [Daucus carota subsp. sativus]|uniref:uncharacterized protein LOC108194553 isoform X6 n=1 Tax=Daucus carota subsp. sativus TaxID=79200 RepID=UPI0030832B9A
MISLDRQNASITCHQVVANTEKLVGIYSHGKGKVRIQPRGILLLSDQKVDADIDQPYRISYKGEKVCYFYRRTGSCKYGENCRFHHPNPTAARGLGTTLPGRGELFIHQPHLLLKMQNGMDIRGFCLFPQHFRWPFQQLDPASMHIREAR